MIQMMCTVSSRFKTILYFILFHFSILCVCRFFDTSVSVVRLLLLKIIYFFVSFFSFCVFLMTHNRPLPVFLTHTKHSQSETMSIACTYVCMQSHTRALYYFLSLSRTPATQWVGASEHDAFQNQPFRTETAMCIVCKASHKQAAEQRQVAIRISIKMATGAHKCSNTLMERNTHTHTRALQTIYVRAL